MILTVREKIHFLKTFKKYPNVNLNIILPKVFIIMWKIKKVLPDYVLGKANILIQGEDIIVDGKYNFGRGWPSTGILESIIIYQNMIKFIYQVSIILIQKKKQFIIMKKKTVSHQHSLEKQIVDDLIEKDWIIRL